MWNSEIQVAPHCQDIHMLLTHAHKKAGYSSLDKPVNNRKGGESGDEVNVEGDEPWHLTQNHLVLAMFLRKTCYLVLCQLVPSPASPMFYSTLSSASIQMSIILLLDIIIGY